MNHQQAVEKVVDECRRLLNWDTLSRIEKEYDCSCDGCQSLPPMVLEAVFSINAKAKAASNVVAEYQTKAGVRTDQEQTIDEFLAFVGPHNPEQLADLLHNRMRTSPRHGILKAEAAVRFAKVLQKFHVNRVADKDKILDSDKFCRHIRAIPGQYLSCDYFLMMLGRKDLVKADRMVLRFLRECLDGQQVDANMAYTILNDAADRLTDKCRKLQPRFLDNMIWEYERSLDTAPEK